MTIDWGLSPTRATPVSSTGTASGFSVTPSGIAVTTASRSQVDGPASSSLTTAVCRFLFGSHRVSGTRKVLSGDRKYSDAGWNVRVKSCSCRISPSGTPEMRHCLASSCTRSNVTDSAAFGGAST